MHHFKALFQFTGRKKKGAQTTSLSTPVPDASGSASPAPLNPTDRPLSAPPIGRARQVGNEYGPFHPNPSTSTNEPPSIPHVSNTIQDSNESALSHLDLAAPRAVVPYNCRSIQDGFNPQPLPVIQANDGALLGSNLRVPAALSPSSLSAPDPTHRLPSPTPATATLQGVI